MTRFTMGQIIVLVGVGLTIGVLGLRAISAPSPHTDLGSLRVDISELYELPREFRYIASHERREQIRDIPECADQLAADQYFDRCIELLKTASNLDCGVLVGAPKTVSVPKDFEQAHLMKILNYRNAPDICQKRGIGIIGQGYLSGRVNKDDE